MSFGGGGSGGQIRYALLLDDQATAKLGNFKNSLISTAGGTKQLQTQMQQMSNQLGVTTEKVKSMATQANSLGTRIKDSASKFSGFATGLSATTSGVLQLASGFRDYNDASIAVERVTRKNSLAHEALTKAQDKLNALTSKGIKSGKDYQQAQLDVSQAQSQVSIQTQLLGEAQERMFDSQSQFVASVIPATLGAVGTLGAAFKDLGGSKGMGGLVDKFKNLGSSATGAIGSKGSGILGIGIALAGIGAVAITAFDAVGKINEQLDTMRKVSSGAIKPMEGVRMELDRVAKIDTTSIQGIIETIGSLFSGSFGAANIVKNLTKDLKDANPEVKTFSSGIKIYADNTVEATKATQDELNVLSRRNEAMAKARQQDIDVAAALGEVITKTTASANAAKGEAAIIVGFGANVQTLKEKFLALDSARKKVFTVNTDMEKFFGFLNNPNPTAITKLNVDLPKLNQHLKESETRFKAASKAMGDDLKKAAEDARSAIDKMQSGVKSGLDKIIEAFHNVHKKGKLDFEVNFDKAKKSYDKFLAEVGDKLDHGGSANAQKYVLAFEQKGTEGMTKSQKRIFQPIFDWIEKHKDEPPTIFMSGFLQMLATYEPDVSQQFQKLLNPSIGLAGEIGQKAGAQFAKDLMAEINDALKTADRFANMGGHPGRGSLKDKGNPPAANSNGLGFNIGLQALPPIGPRKKVLKDFHDSNIVPSLPDFPIGKDKGGQAIPGANKLISLNLDNRAAIKAIDVVATRIQDLAKIIPTLTVINAKAIKAIDVIAIQINDLAKVNPTLAVVNAKAIKAVDVIAKRIDGLAKINPTIVVKNDKALKAIDAIAKRITSLPDGNVTVHVKTVGGAISAQKGLHAYFLEDTTIMAHKGERVDIGHGNEGKDGGVTFNNMGGGGGSGGAGDVFNFHIHVGDKELVRSIKRQSAGNRFTMGA